MSNSSSPEGAEAIFREVSEEPAGTARGAISIAFRGQGKAIRLASPVKWRRAIELNDLNPDMVIDVHQGDGPGLSVRAGDVPELQPHFEGCGMDWRPMSVSPPGDIGGDSDGATGIDQGLRETEQGDASTAASGLEEGETPGPGPSPEAETKPVAAVNVAQSATAAAKAIEEAPAAAPAASRTAGKPDRSGAPWAWAGAAIVAILVVLGVMRMTQENSAPDPVTVYVNRPVNVRPEPTNDRQPPLAQLPRGQELHGQWVSGKDPNSKWFKLSDGDFRSRYVWGRNLSAVARPTRRQIIVQKLWIVAPTALYAEPTFQAPITQTLERPIQVCVGGRMNSGSLGSDWWEILIMNGRGGVGYLPPGGLARNQDYRTIQDETISGC